MNLLVNILKKIYMLSFSIYSKIIVRFKTKEQIVFLMSFPDNNLEILTQLIEEFDVIVYYTKSSEIDSSKLPKSSKMTVRSMETPIGLLNAVRDITRSRVTICDNYFPLLGTIEKKKSRKIIQIWHATGAIKNFGFKDNQFKLKNNSDRRRFLSVYKAFDYYVVASKKMGDIFKASYGASDEQMLYLGFLRSDSLFNRSYELEKRPQKTIVYLPTYREKQKSLPPLNVALLENELSSDFQLIVKLHPHIQELANGKKDTRFVSWHSDKRTEELIQEADVLITDYSSVAFDYSLIKPKGKLIFYWYDEIEYQQTTGIQEGVKETLPGRICYDTKQIVTSIKENKAIDMTSFNEIWNTYNDGESIARFISYLKEIGE